MDLYGFDLISIHLYRFISTPEPDIFFPQEELYAEGIDMCSAAKNGLLHVAGLLLLSSDTSISQIDHLHWLHGQVPLHFAASYGHVQMIYFLVASNADVNVM